jgi:hypothetical protein
MAKPGPPIPKTLLSLDGGGIKGISTLVILEAIMKEIRSQEKDDAGDDRLPFYYLT